MNQPLAVPIIGTAFCMLPATYYTLVIAAADLQVAFFVGLTSTCL
jgi:hypothetical protein